MTQKNMELGAPLGSAVVPKSKMPSAVQLQRYVYVREVRPDDALQITSLLDQLDQEEVSADADEKTARFGIFNGDGDLFWLYENMECVLRDTGRMNRFVFQRLN